MLSSTFLKHEDKGENHKLTVLLLIIAMKAIFEYLRYFSKDFLIAAVTNESPLRDEEC